MGMMQFNMVGMRPAAPVPNYHAQWTRQTISLNDQLNAEATMRVNGQEPKFNIWDDSPLSEKMGNMGLDRKTGGDEKQRLAAANASSQKRLSRAAPPKEKSSKFSGFKKKIGIKSSEEKAEEMANWLHAAIVTEERARWPDDHTRYIIDVYQDKVGMRGKIVDLRLRCPLQYLHLLKAGYFEPIPLAWAYQASNPMKFSIEASAGWRGITPAWRGYEDLAEERLYWVLNHRAAGSASRMKPDFISEMRMAMERMARAEEPPLLYYSPTDTCRVEHTSDGTYSKQVLSQFRVYDRPEQASDDTMILLDVSRSMDFNPVRPVYNQYLITGYTGSTQPKNKGKWRKIEDLVRG